ncbi:hypothetical protein IMG5_093040 [Ichthyophthirius multifiliis]|uniref:EF-hand domain-containing protein n=1 Tax=Ichthyophthirius multifiliis TaxID=5932 RepID=G0QRH4_ICHMU|nr:hypothetical protein IMG5_093040 [Ichthyophthirius multifiliis]EGR32180.1 hypothetical protein IMG5_093040 [Ichthyophthirius multifiliis]|eukprot:XP_004035666.1 hypothetical protein IMG5_093040 [Ichthyophthirius multifiliis]
MNKTQRDFSASQITNFTLVSQKSQRLIEDVSQKSTSKIYRLKGIFNCEDIRVSWNAFGIYLKKKKNIIFLYIYKIINQVCIQVDNQEWEDLQQQKISDNLHLQLQILNQKDVVIHGKEINNQGAQYFQYLKISQKEVAQNKVYIQILYQDLMELKEQMAECLQIKLTLQKLVYILKWKKIKQKHVQKELLNNYKIKLKMKIMQIWKYLMQAFLELEMELRLFNLMNFQVRMLKIFLINIKIQVLGRKRRNEFNKRKFKKFCKFKKMQDNLNEKPDDILEIDESTKNYLKKSMNIDYDQLKNRNKRSIFDTLRYKSSNQISNMNKTQVYKDNLKTTHNKQNSIYFFNPYKDNNHAFVELCKNCKGKHYIGIKLTNDDIFKGIRKLNLDLNPLQITELHRILDKNKDGFVDLDDWMNVIVSNCKTMQREDDWQWTNDVLNKIKQWYKNEGLSIQDAFRVFDQDFDGYINKKDIENFLLQVLKLSDKEIEPQRINRIFKLMDEFKRGAIKMADLNRLLSEEKQNFVVTGGKFIEGRDSLDWKINAKQQIGLVLSRQYQNLEQSFEQISNYKNRIIYSQFEQWVEKSRALQGFNLNNQLIQQVFSDLDPHKKGYLTKKDWIQNFSVFNFQIQMIKEVQETVNSSFSTMQEAFNFFSNKQKFITFSQFENGIKNLFLDRFNNNDINTLWFKLADNNNKTIDFQNFLYIFGDKRSALQQQEHPKTFQLGGIQKKLKYASFDPITEEIVAKVQQILRTSNKNIDEIFKEFDKDNSGNISNLEFKSAFRNLSIGLTSKEIDVLLNFCDESGEGIVNWKEFLKKFNKNECQQRILERCKQRLKLINDDIHYYMLSPKDAFRHFNISNTGYMKFEEFYTFMQKLTQYGNYPLPPFEILRDLFDIIDVRKDNLIDINEWLQTFSQFKPPDSSLYNNLLQINSKEVKEQQEKQIKMNSYQKSLMVYDLLNQRLDLLKIKSPLNMNKKMDCKTPLKQLETSKEYDDIMTIIGRNRKYLTNIFTQIEKKQQAITYDMVKSIIGELLRSIGIVIDDFCYCKLIKFAEKTELLIINFSQTYIKKEWEEQQNNQKLKSYKNYYQVLEKSRKKKIIVLIFLFSVLFFIFINIQYINIFIIKKIILFKKRYSILLFILNIQIYIYIYIYIHQYIFFFDFSFLLLLLLLVFFKAFLMNIELTYFLNKESLLILIYFLMSFINSKVFTQSKVALSCYYLNILSSRTAQLISKALNYDELNYSKLFSLLKI